MEEPLSRTLEWELWEILVGRATIETYETFHLGFLSSSAEHCQHAERFARAAGVKERERTSPGSLVASRLGPCQR